MNGRRRSQVVSLGRWVLGVGCSIFGAAGAAGTQSAGDAPPKLISTTGGGSKWSTTAELAPAARAGDPLACFQYGYLLETGAPDVPKNESQALTFYERAAQGGNGEALFRLGKAHHDGLLGLKQDYAKALSHYREAARRGVAEAQYNVGAMFVSARGVKRDYMEGLAWLIVAKQNGAPGGGVEQVKQRLRSTPARIAAAERRAAELAEELKQPGGNLSPDDGKKAPSPPPLAPKPQAKISVPAAEKIAPAPGFALPLPPPAIDVPAPKEKKAP